jgi:hypothetical protein
MKSMFLVIKLSSHSYIGYASLTILLPWTTHKQHQNYSKAKAFQNQNFNSHKLCIHTITLYKMKVFLKVTNTSLNTNQKETNQETSKTYPPHGSPNNQKEQNHKETKSHCSPCDSTINHKEITSHGSPCDSTINHKETTSHGSPCDSTINHKEITSHGSPCDSTIITRKQHHMVPNVFHN